MSISRRTFCQVLAGAIILPIDAIRHALRPAPVPDWSSVASWEASIRHDMIRHLARQVDAQIMLAI